MRRARVEIAAALLLGLAAFLIVVGPSPLDPTNIAWLAQHDAATNFLGWSFFRASPWTWPLAANPDYGMDIAGSVMMADANPLLALPFKLLDPWLPEPFQYFGWWLLGCFLLQALFARAIAARLTGHCEQRLAIAALFLFAPCFLIRIATPAVFHMTLAGQWQILAAFWLYFSPDLSRRWLRWAGLLVVATLTHPYLLAIVAGLWVADVLRQLMVRKHPPAAILGGAAAALAVTLLIAKQSGVFWLQGAMGPTAEPPLRSYGEFGFGLFKANSLSLFDSEGWSWLLPDLPSTSGEIEGFGFFGFGMLMVAAAALILQRRGKRAPDSGWHHAPLPVVMLAFAIFALSPNIGIGAYVVQLDWPGAMRGLGNLFRSSGRFVWPLVYWAMIEFCWMLSRNASRRLGSTLLIAAALIQVADTSAGWRSYAATLSRHGQSWPTKLVSPFWKEAARRYRAVRLIVPRNHSPIYRDLAAWALANGMRTDIVYLARYDLAAFEALKKSHVEQLRAGTLARDTLWITEGTPPEALARMPRVKGDMLGVVDGIGVYAPARQ